MPRIHRALAYSLMLVCLTSCAGDDAAQATAVGTPAPDGEAQPQGFANFNLSHHTNPPILVGRGGVRYYRGNDLDVYPDSHADNYKIRSAGTCTGKAGYSLIGHGTELALVFTKNGEPVAMPKEVRMTDTATGQSYRFVLSSTDNKLLHWNGTDDCDLKCDPGLKGFPEEFYFANAPKVEYKKGNNSWVEGELPFLLYTKHKKVGGTTNVCP